jgi:Helix-turn-helix domain
MSKCTCSAAPFISTSCASKSAQTFSNMTLSRSMASPLRLQAFKCALRPNGEQLRNLRQFAGSCRLVYNKALALNVERYEKKESGTCLHKLLSQKSRLPQVQEERPTGKFSHPARLRRYPRLAGEPVGIPSLQGRISMRLPRAKLTRQAAPRGPVR